MHTTSNKTLVASTFFAITLLLVAIGSATLSSSGKMPRLKSLGRRQLSPAAISNELVGEAQVHSNSSAKRRPTTGGVR